MKITIDAEKLAHAAARVRAGTGSRTTLPILHCMLLRADNGVLTLTANNLDTLLEVKVPCEVREAGAVAVPAARLASAAPFFAGEITLEATAKKAAHSLRMAQNGVRTIELAALPAEEYPPTEEMPAGAAAVDMAEGEIAQTFGLVLPFCSQDSSRYVICGVHVEARKDRTLFVATDGRRLAQASREGIPTEIDAIVPEDGVKKLCALAKAGAVRMSFTDGRFSAQSEDWRLIGKLIEGNFPNFRRVIPANGKVRVTYEPDAMIAAIELTDSVAPEERAAYRNCKITAAPKSLTVMAKSPDVGETEAVVPGGRGTVAFEAAYQSDYLISAIRAIGGEEQTLDTEDERSAAVIRRSDGSALVVTMPMRVS